MNDQKNNSAFINKLETLEASVKVSDTNVAKVDTEDYIKIIAKKAGVTKVTISLNNNGQAAEKSFNIIILKAFSMLCIPISNWPMEYCNKPKLK